MTTPKRGRQDRLGRSSEARTLKMKRDRISDAKRRVTEILSALPPKQRLQAIKALREKMAKEEL
jgi:hypothetical protein